MSYSAEAYYDQEHGEHPVIVRTAEDVDALVDAVAAADFSTSLVNLYITERPRNAAGVPDHELGVGVDAERAVGALSYLGPGGTWYSLGMPTDLPDGVCFFYLGNDTPFPSDSEIPLTLLRRAVKEFLASGGDRPTCVGWQR